MACVTLRVIPKTEAQMPALEGARARVSGWVPGVHRQNCVVASDWRLVKTGEARIAGHTAAPGTRDAFGAASR